MKILAIETSCDETAIAVINCHGELPSPEFEILGNNLHSQIAIHREYGGVYPTLAKREHLKNLPIILEKTIQDAGIDTDAPDIDYIAVTAGPGLEPALWTGIEFAKTLGEKWSKPVLPINHMAGHLFSFLFEKSEPIEFPAIALLVSGGHTELVLMESFAEYKIIGRTRDDAVGEAFDKTARILGFPYPGGPKISELAAIDRARSTEPAFDLPSPMLATDDYDFSYSGLKTAVLYLVKKLGNLNDDQRQQIARGFEEAAIAPLLEKTKRAVEEFGARSIILGGGVSANQYLREKLSILSVETSTDLRLPLPSLTTDNAIMIAIAAYVGVLTERAHPASEIRAKGNLSL